ncbi:PilZ domain-containing protein [Nitrospira sp. Nam80]|jgi:hypothetical protein
MDESKPFKNNVIELRRHPRFRMSPPVVLSFARSELSVSFDGDHQGEGTVVNLSAKGCKVLSHAQVRAGDRLSLSLHIAQRPAPLAINPAYVRWVDVDSFGLEWTALPSDVERTLLRLIASNP